MKVVINSDFGGFSVSQEVYDKLGIPWDEYGYIRNEDLGLDGDDDTYRSDPRLIAAVIELGDKANHLWSSLKVIEIPDGIKYMIEEHDGKEWVAEYHQTWG